MEKWEGYQNRAAGVQREAELETMEQQVCSLAAVNEGMCYSDWGRGWCAEACACTGSAPKLAAQLHNHPGSEQLQDVRDGDGFIFWTGSP